MTIDTAGNSGTSAPHQPSLDPAEVEKFSKMAAEWWNPKGKFGVLHVFNPVRLDYIKEQVTARLGRDPLARQPFEGLRILDIGCGGGLLCEPMARLGARVVGVDPSEKNIKTASVHSQEMGLDIDYRVGLAEDLARAGETFDVILNMEVIEHVADPAAYTQACVSMLKPGGLMFVATINRTGKAFALAIVGAEYVLGWLPKGTHQWEKFITPDELKGWLSANGAVVKDESGVSYHPLANTWRRSRDMGVNYMLVAEKRPAN
ncbi:bifunctional 2-polyprenyl-6-hydroxyphenol methylase/3-demethylubiquinol 3-O-methyltransferase UbiG [Aestuariivirga sp.]|uniref:bifunctional 2-polyprenyl-6-hydroxyphenol methylase/3-demethylubiquinol 3-O-methyltransferase UbiG n=1 Tax=Aestuariivirga sp. TaxID=2650926 RepID=UPI0039E257A7